MRRAGLAGRGGTAVSCGRLRAASGEPAPLGEAAGPGCLLRAGCGLTGSGQPAGGPEASRRLPARSARAEPTRGAGPYRARPHAAGRRPARPEALPRGCRLQTRGPGPRVQMMAVFAGRAVGEGHKHNCTVSSSFARPKRAVAAQNEADVLFLRPETNLKPMHLPKRSRCTAIGLHLQTRV